MGWGALEGLKSPVKERFLRAGDLSIDREQVLGGSRPPLEMTTGQVKTLLRG